MKTSSKQITHWGNPREVFLSQYGELSYLNWCKAEQVRFAESDKSTKIIENDDGQIALSK